MAYLLACEQGASHQEAQNVRHSGEGRNPAILFNMPLGFVLATQGFHIQLDSGFRRNDEF
jgi:hypothetical protein